MFYHSLMPTNLEDMNQTPHPPSRIFIGVEDSSLLTIHIHDDPSDLDAGQVKKEVERGRLEYLC